MKTRGKRKSYSEEPDLWQVSKKRCIEALNDIQKFGPITACTPYRNHISIGNTRLAARSSKKYKIEELKSMYARLLQPFDFKSEYSKIESVLKILFDKKKKKSAKLKLSSEEKKRLTLLDNFLDDCTDFQGLGEVVGFSRQKVRNIYLKWKKTGNVFREKRGRKMKLNEEHLQYLSNFVKNPNYFGKTVIDMREALIEAFNLEPDDYKVSCVYKGLKRLNLTFKKIIWKKPKDNELTTKKKRHLVAQDLLKFHSVKCRMIFLDESGFNLNIRPTYFWGPKGQLIHGSRPVKSCNYSLLAAMDYEKIIGWVLFKGGVKKEDFFWYLMELIKNEMHSFKKIAPVFFMDNARIHKSKTYMTGIFNKYYDCLYNAPYSPQLNPIEYAFSKIKSLVAKRAPMNESDLISAIEAAIKEIGSKDCAGYVWQSFKFMKTAYDMEDFI